MIKRVLAAAVGLAMLGSASFAATADAVSSLTLDFRFDGLGGSTVTGGGFGGGNSAGVDGDAINIFNASKFDFSFGTALGLSDVGSALNIGGSSANYSGFSGPIFGSSFSLVASEPLFVRLNLVSGSVDPFDSFRVDLRGASFSTQGVLVEPPAVPLPAGMLLMGTALGAFGVARRKKKAA